MFTIIVFLLHIQFCVIKTEVIIKHLKFISERGRCWWWPWV